MEDNKTQGGGAKRRPFGAAPKAPPCCLPFGKDFLCFASFLGPILGRFPEFGPNLVRIAPGTHPEDFKIVFLGAPIGPRFGQKFHFQLPGAC